jgi:hypothetical protein
MEFEECIYLGHRSNASGGGKVSIQIGDGAQDLTKKIEQNNSRINVKTRLT